VFKEVRLLRSLALLVGSFKLVAGVNEHLKIRQVHLAYTCLSMFSRFSRRLISLLLKVFLTLTIISACGGNLDYPAAKLKQPIENCRKVQHSLGKICVPLNPQRVITLWPAPFANALALGIKPIATTYDTSQDFPEYLRGQASGIELIGDISTPNLEKILRLKPDLILANPWLTNIYEQLSYIAPTYIPPKELSFEKQLLELANVLGKEELGDHLIKDYWQKITEIKQTLGVSIASPRDNSHHQIQVSVARMLPTGIYAYGNQSNIARILRDIGLQRPPSQRGDFYTLDNISLERLSDIDGDVLFLLNQGGVSEEIIQKPLWKQLKAVQQNQVYFVGYHWHFLDILAVNAIIDDLFKYLVNTP
jgi:iron complex transport system substrate-binding protein